MNFGADLRERLVVLRLELQSGESSGDDKMAAKAREAIDLAAKELHTL